MKKVILFTIGLILAGTFAYFGGYYLYISNRPQIEFEEPLSLQHGMTQINENLTDAMPEYYLARIEEEMLLIYKMPEETIYDSLKTGNLQFQEKDYPMLLEGMVFQDLSEVYEFLENCMS